RLRRLHALTRGPGAGQGAQPRPREHRGRHPPQQVSVPHDRSRDHPRRGSEMGEAVVGALPAGEEDRKGKGMNRKSLTLAVLVATLAGALALPAAAQLGGSMEEIAAYDKPDRDQKLAEAAKKEGNLTIYTSAQSDDMGALVAGFEKKYGIKVEMWRASSEKVL